MPRIDGPMNNVLTVHERPFDSIMGFDICIDTMLNNTATQPVWNICNNSTRYRKFIK